MSQAFTLSAAAGLEVYDSPWQDMKRQHWSALLEILLRLRSRIVQDPNRLRSAAEAWGRFLPHSDFHYPPSDSDVNVWFAALVQSTNRQSQMVFTISEEANIQIWHLAKTLAAAKTVIDGHCTCSSPVVSVSEPDIVCCAFCAQYKLA